MKQMLEEEYPAFLNSYEDARYQALRINPSKTDRNRFAEETSFHLQPVPWEANGFITKGRSAGKTSVSRGGRVLYSGAECHGTGCISGCAAGRKSSGFMCGTGGKSTQIAAAMQGKGLLVSNEIHPARAKILSENMERMGVKNVMVTNESPQTLAGMFTEYFDRIMVDAPCSGEGMFRKMNRRVRSGVLKMFRSVRRGSRKFLHVRPPCSGREDVWFTLPVPLHRRKTRERSAVSWNSIRSFILCR